MKTGWTTHSWNGAIWLALSPCHMTMTCKINKLEKPGGPLSIFHTLFGRSAAFYGHFRVDTVTSEWSTHIWSSPGTYSWSNLGNFFFQFKLSMVSCTLDNGCLSDMILLFKGLESQHNPSEPSFPYCYYLQWIVWWWSGYPSFIKNVLDLIF